MYRVPSHPLFVSNETVTPVIVKVQDQGLDSVLELEDLQNWENLYGKIPNKAVVVVHTGHGR